MPAIAQRAAPARTHEQIAAELVSLLHQAAPAEEFASRLAEIELLPSQHGDKAAAVELVRMAMAVRNRLELWQQRESGLLTVIESARDLSARLELNELLRTVVSRARNMLGSHLAWLSTFDAAAGEFHVLATDGALAKGTRTMVAARNRGIVSVVMETRLPFSTPDYLHDSRFAHDPDLDATFREEGVLAVVGVPLLWEGEVIGLLFVADRYHRTHSAHSISILSTLATHAALAIKNAMAFQQAQDALHSAEQARAELERHVRKVQGAAEAHAQMTSLLARGASLTALCESLAGLLEGGVLVLDEAGQVIGQGGAPGDGASAMAAYSPHAETSSALTRALRQSRQVGRSVVAYEAGGETCRAIAVIGGDDVLGAVLLFRRADDLDDVAIRTFERSATVIGIVLLSRERIEATKTRDMATLLRSLLSPRQDDLALLCERAQAFGLDLAQPTSLVVIDVADANAPYAARRLRNTGSLGGALSDEIDGALVLLTATTRAAAHRQALLDLATSLGTGFRGVLSRPLPTPDKIPATYTTLRRALPVLRRMGVEGQVLAQNEMALYATLFETHDQDSLAAFLATTIGAVTHYDQKRGTELAQTLLCYFDANQNAKAAAQRLGIHVNTVRQRLATIEDLLGHWGNATRALEIHIALRLWGLGDAELRRKVSARPG